MRKPVIAVVLGPDLPPMTAEQAIFYLERFKVGWQSPEAAPKDGTLLHLLIKQGQGEEDAFTPFDDSREPYETIGFNNLSNTGEDRWQFAGWDWQHNCIVTGAGEVIGWVPFVRNPPTEETTSEGTE